MSQNKNNYTRNFIIVVGCLLFVSIGFLLFKNYPMQDTTVYYDTITVTDAKLRALYDTIDSLKTENGFLQVELDAYKHKPAKVLASIRQSYEEKRYLDIKDSLEFLEKYHPETRECAAVKKIYRQALKELEADRKKVSKEEAKTKSVERIMAKYGCSRGMAECINNRQIKIGMTKDMVIAVLGKPYDINRTGGSFGVQEQWCYGGNLYLYFENGILTLWQD